MRASREAAAATRSRIVETAARMFRKHGLEATSIADVMHAAGLTHGGFYKHFPNKEALEVEAVRAAFDELRARLDAGPGNEKRAKAEYVKTYLSTAHVSHPERGCPVAALGAESGRSGKPLKEEFAAGMEDMIERFIIADGRRSGSKDRTRAIRQLAMMVGAVVVARSCGDGKLAQDVLTAAHTELV